MFRLFERKQHVTLETRLRLQIDLPEWTGRPCSQHVFHFFYIRMSILQPLEQANILESREAQHSPCTTTTTQGPRKRTPSLGMFCKWLYIIYLVVIYGSQEFQFISGAFWIVATELFIKLIETFGHLEVLLLIVPNSLDKGNSKAKVVNDTSTKSQSLSPWFCNNFLEPKWPLPFLKVNPPKQGLKLHSKQGSVGFRVLIGFTTSCVSYCHVRPLGPCSTISLKSAICFHVHRNPWLPQRGMLAIALPALPSQENTSRLTHCMRWCQVSLPLPWPPLKNPQRQKWWKPLHWAPWIKNKKNSKSVCSRNSALFLCFWQKKNRIPMVPHLHQGFHHHLSRIRFQLSGWPDPKPASTLRAVPLEPLEGECCT